MQENYSRLVVKRCLNLLGYHKYVTIFCIMAQKRRQASQPSARELTNNISSDLQALLKHVNDLGRLLISRRNVRIAIRVIIAVACVVSLIVIKHDYDNQCICGDEPHYVLMEYSLVHDHDFNLGNNFAHHDSSTFGSYGPNGLTAAGQVGPGQVKTPGHQYSIHGIGLPLLLWPGYELAKVNGMMVEMVLIAVGVLFLTYYLCKEITKSIKWSFLASFALFFSYVFYGIVGEIFPDVAIGAVIAASLLIVLKKPTSLVWQVVLGIILGFSVLLHYKMLGFAGVTFLTLCYKTWTMERKLPYVAAVPLLFFVILLLYQTHTWFGIWNPSGVLGDLGVGLHPASTPKNLSAILFDAARGFIPNNPIYLLLFVGLPIWFRGNRESLVIIILCILPQVATFVMFNDWRGGDSPAGRYIMNFLPVLMPAMAYAFMYLRKFWQRLLVVALFIINIVITIYFVKIKLGWLGVTSSTSSSILLNTPLAFDRWFPNFSIATNLMGHHDWLKAVAWFFVLIGLMYYGYIVSVRADQRVPSKR